MPKQTVEAPLSKGPETDINAYIRALKQSPSLGGDVAYHRILPARPPLWQETAAPFPETVRTLLRNAGIPRLYRHQAQAIDHVRAGRHVAVATPTASGKSLVYNLPVMEKIGEDLDARALYVFPLKALAQDQLRHFHRLSEACPGTKPTAEIYDGDTPAAKRRRLRRQPPHVVLTNPEMIHLSILPYHEKWQGFLRHIHLVVIDEMHVYRGILGAHIAQVIRRLRRILLHYGVSPTFVLCSATVGNPSRLAGDLTGLDVAAIQTGGAARGRRHLVVLNPTEGQISLALKLAGAALHRRLRTIIYAQSRKLAELITVWIRTRTPRFRERISVYRAGLTPRARREIETRLMSGDLLAVISTSALELGIDVGDLDLCILVGYPGSLVSTWQRGGRVGRKGKDAALVLVAGEDALDQYFVRHPEELIRKAPESAVLNPYNREVLSRHLVCTAAELPLDSGDAMMLEQGVASGVASLVAEGRLLAGREGQTYYSARRMPHREVDLRGIGQRLSIVDGERDRIIGDIDLFRACKETHPGAVYMHQSDTYVVDGLDTETRTVSVRRSDVDYYTRVRSVEDTRIIDRFQEKRVGGTRVCYGRLSVTEQVTGYEKRRIRDHVRLDAVDLELPPLVFETEGLWFAVPSRIRQQAEAGGVDLMGAIHALEHGAIGILPLLVMADRNDFGGVSMLFHPQVGDAAIFIFDGVPGGAGLSRMAFEKCGDLFERTLELVRSCGCRAGCPSCVHSPKCGSGNRPMDKAGAGFVLERLMQPTGRAVERREPDDLPESEKKEPLGVGRRAGRMKKRLKRRRHSERDGEGTGTNVPGDGLKYGVFDLETQRSAQEVGGWHRADRMRISCAVVYDSMTDDYTDYTEAQVPELIRHLERLDLVVGFNSKRFDYRVLSGYQGFQPERLKSLDILEHIHRRLGFRLSLNHLAKATLGLEKSADGLQALKWWKEGRLKEILSYCRKDVEITRNLYEYGKKNGFLLFDRKSDGTVRVPVEWSYGGDSTVSEATSCP